MSIKIIHIVSVACYDAVCAFLSWRMGFENIADATKVTMILTSLIVTFLLMVWYKNSEKNQKILIICEIITTIVWDTLLLGSILQ